MTTLLERHAATLEAEEEALAAVYRAGVKWEPAGREAIAAAAKRATAERQVQEAQAECNRLLQEVTERNVELGNDLTRHHNAGTLTREAIGEGGGKRIKDLLSAETKLKKAKEEFSEATKRSSVAANASNLLVRDILQALDALKPHVSFETHHEVSRVFEDGPKDPARVADSCRTRLSVLGLSK
jgi:hypothetical protein